MCHILQRGHRFVLPQNQANARKRALCSDGAQVLAFANCKTRLIHAVWHMHSPSSVHHPCSMHLPFDLHP
eukprot:3934942-Rhodomonas_salina.5